MKNVKNPLYIPADLEIITFECNDIVTASGLDDDYVSDPNVDKNW